MTRRLPIILSALGLALAGSAGFLVSSALSAQAPARTVTINVATGPRGPAGPAGPAGPEGPPGPAAPPGGSCPTDYTAGKLVINHPGGQTAIWTCLHD